MNVSQNVIGFANCKLAFDKIINSVYPSKGYKITFKKHGKL